MLALVLALLPPAISAAIRRKTGARIASDASIAWLAIVDVQDLEMSSGAQIGSLCLVRARRLRMGRRASVRPLSILSTHTVELGEAVHIAPGSVIYAGLSSPRARFIAGDHSRIFPLCWIEPGEGVELGRHVGIGGHGLIFTHGSWSDYLSGGPMAYAPVTIEDRVWLPWRVTVQAGVTIGADSIVMSGSVVTRSLPANVMAGGAPAKVIREVAIPEIGPDAQAARAAEIVAAFEVWYAELHGQPTGIRIGIDHVSDLVHGDVWFRLSDAGDPAHALRTGVAVVDHRSGTFYASGSPVADEFADFIERYGIRLYRR